MRASASTRASGTLMTPRLRPDPAPSAWRPVSALKTVVFPAPGKPVSPTFMPPRGPPRPGGGPRSSSRPRSRRAGSWRAPREREARDLGDHLVGLVALRRRAEAARQEEVDALVTEAGGGEDRADVSQLVRLYARLLGEPARRAGARPLVGRIEDAAGQPAEFAGVRAAPVAQRDAASG